MAQIFFQFLWLGCICFGGPAAHIGYFRRVFVDQKRWLSAEDFAALLALSQFLPGPASSQLGFAIACHRGGAVAGVLAFLGFTLPSFLLMFALAVWGMQQDWLDSGLVAGLKLLAVVVVADAIISMARQFCRHPSTQLIGCVSAALLLWQMTPLLQIALLLLAAFWMAVRAPAGTPGAIRPGRESAAYFLLFLLLAGTTLVTGHWLFSQFFQVGSIVFGGGHVVLPLLEGLLDGALPQDQFLLGYAAAQAVPGPMFSFASYLGAVLMPSAPLVGALAATLGIFAPGFILLLALRPVWTQVSTHSRLKAAITGVNAVAVGMLLAAWVNPVLLSAPHSPVAILVAVLGLLALRSGRVRVLPLIALFASLGVAFW